MPNMDRRAFLKTTAAATIALGATQAHGADAPKNRFPKAIQWGKIPGEGTDEEKIKLTVDAGFDGIEAYPMADLAAAKVRGDLAKSLNCPIHSVTYGGWGAPMSSPDPEVIKKGHAEIDNAIRTAHAMGADTMLLVPAVVTEEVSYAMAWENSVKNIRPMIPLAEELGIVIGIENVWNKFLLSPLEFAAYIDEFDSAWVQAYFDVGNVVIFGYPEDWIRTLGKRIHKVQWKDFKRKSYEWCKLPYEGDVNWPEVHQSLIDIGYDSWGTEEFPKGDEAQFRELARRMELLGQGAASA